MKKKLSKILLASFMTMLLVSLYSVFTATSVFADPPINPRGYRVSTYTDPMGYPANCCGDGSGICVYVACPE